MSRYSRPVVLLPLLEGALLATLALASGDRGAAEARFASAEEILRLAGRNGLHSYHGSRFPHV